MIPFLLGLIVGAISGIILMAILSIRSISDKKMEHMMKNYDTLQVGKQLYNLRTK